MSDRCASQVTIQLLGPFHVLRDGEPLPRVRARKGHWLLALLILRHPRQVERTWLAGTLWPDLPEPQALGSLRSSLTDLRAALGPDAGRLRSPSPQTLALDLDGVAVDVLAFDEEIDRGDLPSLERAVALYQGPLLEGCAEEWVLEERQRREQAYLEALERLAATALAAGDRGTAVRYLRQAVAADPFQESTHRSLMELLAAVGSYAAAAQVYRDLRLRLHRELNAEPDPETNALFDRIRASERARAAGRGISSRPRTGVRPGSLPVPLSRFVGRERELARLQEWLPRHRLVTLTGAGGCGKTRLAIEVATRLRDGFCNNVWFVSLVDLMDPSLLLDGIRDALDLPRSPGVTALEQLAAVLSCRPALLVLDNWEHLLPDGAVWAKTLLERVEGVTILATSRRRLGLAGERLLPVLPLPVPDGASLLPQSLLQYSGVQLLVDRAQAVQPDFEVTERNAPAVAALCARLEGVPLALELAAARLGVMTPAQIVARLEDRLNLLTNPAPGADPRHRSLRAALAWSFDLLPPELQRFLARLSVFRGGWSIEAAEVVCGEPRALAFLEQLWGNSLIDAEERGDGMRFRMLESVAEYARGQCEAGERLALEAQHAAYFGALLDQAIGAFYGPEHAAWLERLEREHDNLRAALGRAIERGDLAVSLHLGCRLWRFWIHRHHDAVAWEWLRRLLALAEPDQPAGARTSLLAGAGMVACRRGAFLESRALLEQCVALGRASGEGALVAQALIVLGNMHRGNDAGAARRCYEEALETARNADHPFACGVAHRSLGRLLLAEGQHAPAREHLEAGLAIARAMGDDWGIAFGLGGMGKIALAAGNRSEARSFCEEGLAVARRFGDQWAIGHLLADLAEVAGLAGDHDWAASCREELIALGREAGWQWPIQRALNETSY